MYHDLRGVTVSRVPIAAFALGALLGIATPANSSEPWGWELPHYSEPVQIAAIYQSDDRHIVAWYSSKGVIKAHKSFYRLSGFYDLTTGQEIAPVAEVKAITDHNSEIAFLARHHLTEMHWGENGQGAGIQRDNFAFFRCTYPYEDGISINDADYLIVRKLPRPVAQHYGCSYHGDSMSSASLTTRYQDQPLRNWWSLGSERYVVLTDVPWVIRFDAKGHTHFFDRRTDAGLVQADAIKPLIARMSELDGGSPDPRPLLKRVEAIIDADFAKKR